MVHITHHNTDINLHCNGAVPTSCIYSAVKVHGQLCVLLGLHMYVYVEILSDSQDS